MRTITACIAAAVLTAATAQAGTTYKADTTHAHVGFGVSHLVISTVKGNFDEFTSTLELDDNNQLTYAKAAIEVKSIDTDNEKRDEHLRSADFFDVEKHPQITFESTSVEPVENGANITGDLTIAGVTKEVVLPATVKGPITDPWGNTKLGFETELKIDRTEFGLTWNKTLETGGLVVGNEVAIEINLEYAAE